VNAVASWLEHRQIGLYLAAILAAGVVGLTVPGANHLQAAIEPVLALLLFATFLGVRSPRSGGPSATDGSSPRSGC
jgi:ACR3 family arsenite transporter